jgi:hypothetical protein
MGYSHLLQGRQSIQQVNLELNEGIALALLHNSRITNELSQSRFLAQVLRHKEFNDLRTIVRQRRMPPNPPGALLPPGIATRLVIYSLRRSHNR